MSEKLADASGYRHGNMVFFDLLGVFVVAYPARVGTILNYVVAAATFLYLAKKSSQPGNGGRATISPSGRTLTQLPVVCGLSELPVPPLSGGRYVRDLACATGVAVLSWLVTLLSVLIVALLVTLLGRSMFWYNHFYTSICLYGAAATGKIVLIHTLAKNLYYGVSARLGVGSVTRVGERRRLKYHLWAGPLFVSLTPGGAARGAGRPLLRREPVAVVLQPGVADPAGPVLRLRAHADGGVPAGHQDPAG